MIQCKTITIIIGFVICLTFFYSCGSIKTDYIEKQYYDFTTMSQGQGSSDTGAPLLVKDFTINSAFDSYSFVYRVENKQDIYDYYNEFATYPAKLISGQLAETLYNSIYFSSALAKRPADIKYRLSGKIIKLYGDFQEKSDPKAVIGIRMILEQKRGKTFQKIMDSRYSGTQIILEAKPDQLFKGWNSGLLKIVEKFINDFVSL